MMGSTFAQAWPESAYEFGPIFVSAQLTGRATAMEDTSFFIRRHGYLEEYAKLDPISVSNYPLTSLAGLSSLGI